MKLAFKEASFAIPMVLQNILFAGTSHLIENLPYPLGVEYSILIRQTAGDLGITTPELYETSMAVLLALFCVLAYGYFKKEGRGRAVLQVVRWGSFGIIPLGVEIYLFDRGEFFVASSDFQLRHNFLAWFTNADLLFLSVAVFCAATAVNYFTNSKSAKA